MARCSTCHRRLSAGRSCSLHGSVSSPGPGDAAHDVGHDTGPRPVWRKPVGACIGSGGFASVWEIPGGVLKVAHAAHELARARMAREAEALAAIGAPAVPRLDGLGVLGDGRPWIAMERITGTTLADLLTQPIRIDRALEIAIGILDALVAVHAARFIHRDLKPDNLVRRPDSSIAIIDLGLARKLPSDFDDPTRAGVQVGSLEYISPEQLIDAASVDVRTDLYAFGCVLYELCAGRPPFVGDPAALQRAHAALRPPPLGALTPVPAQVEAVCHECLAKLPRRRPSSVAEVRDRLSAARDSDSLARMYSMSMVSEGKQPVVLLWAELPRVDRALLGALAARKITVISQRGRRVLGGATGAEHADPASTALAAARDLAAAGARVALHLDLLRVTPKLAGDAIDHPEDWVPAGAWTGVALTRALATVSQAPTRDSDAGPGFVTLAEAGEITELFGRDALISDLAADAAAALGSFGPGFALVVGEHGIGKTALAAQLVPRLRELGARVQFGAVPPPGAGRPGHSPLSDLLVQTPDGPLVRAVGDQLRAAARGRPLAIILDDIQLADHELLDAIEYATLGGEPLALWILALGTPRIEQRRPGFGGRAERHRRDVLGPLDEESAVAMTAALLRPAVYPPLRALRQIAGIARGNPLHLAWLVREIHDRGAIRTRPNGEHFLDTTALEALPPIALGPWLAALELAGHSAPLIALARVCAILGDRFERAELAQVVERVERAGGATTTIDVDIGLAELAAATVLVASGAGWTFRQALLQEGIYATTDEDERRVLHQAALELWRTRDLREPAVAERVARHAEAVGEPLIAARAFATLGEHAHRAHRTLDADQAWQGAVRNLDGHDLERGRALLGRARARYRLQRVRDALVDLDAALEIAVARGDAVLEIEVLLERATALDWSSDYLGSTITAERAAERQRAAQLAELAPEIELARARMVYRQARFSDAIAPLDEVVALARRFGHRETETIGLVMLGHCLAEARQIDRAEGVFAELIAVCEETGDGFHLGAAYSNRMILWIVLGQAERAEADLRRVIQLGRELGHATLERTATHNLAEQQLWQGALDEAVNLARRGLSLQRGHGEGSAWVDELLLARILAARGELDETRTLLAGLARHELGEASQIIAGVLTCCVAHSAPPVWESWLLRADRVLEDADLRLELWALAHRHQALSPGQLATARAQAQHSPVWSRRQVF
ncbi:MAG TPA: protein kinase [Kofleriaceae bacterium]|nr:protein kinase [Kofleriaceae bacterium]